MKILKSKTGFFLVYVVSFFVCASLANAEGENIFEQVVTIKFYNNELAVVLKTLSDDTNIQIIYDEKVAKKMVTGSYKNLPFLTAVQRLLGGINYTLTLNEESRTLLVKSFGTANYVTTGTGTRKEYITDVGITPNELRALHEKQYEEYVEQLNDMDEFLDEVGMTRGDLRDLHERQSIKFKQDIQTPSQYLTELGMTRGQLQTMREKQLVDFNAELSSDKTVSTELEMTLGEHRVMLANNASEYDKQQEDGSEYLPEIDMTRAEHRHLLAQQMEEFRQSLTR